MNILASVAITSDGALDDCSAERLRISSLEDWTEVERLRAQYDAILVGAETVRRDDPRLVVADDALRTQRIEQGLEAEIAKITITRTGCLAPDARFFTCGSGRRIVFSTTPMPHLEGLAEQIITPNISAALIVTELEKRGFDSLFVEGGSEILRMFFAEKMIGKLRLAVNPLLHISDASAPRLDIGSAYLDAPHRIERLGVMNVTTYTLHADHSEDEIYLRQAIDLSRLCIPSATSYRVGAVVVTHNGCAFTGYTHETSPTHHAEQEAINKAIAGGAELRGATIYSSMEPCSSRKSEPESCSELILRLGFSRVIFAAYEPNRFVDCCGALNLRKAGVEVRTISALASDVKSINGHLK